MNISPDERSARLNATMDALSATSELVSGAESTYTTNMRRMGGALIFAVVILFGYMLFLEYSTTKKMDAMENEIISMNAIVSSLYLIKVIWSHKLTKQDVKKSLIKFNIPTKAYENTLREIIGKLEMEDQSNQEPVKDTV